jgi:hypothetical protein
MRRYAMNDTNSAHQLGSNDDELIMAALAAGMSYTEAAAAAGSSERTVRRRMSDAHFATEVSRRRAEQVAALTGRLLGASHNAIDVLRNCMDAESDAVRLRAAQLVLTLGAQLRHSQEFEERLAALEAERSPAPSTQSSSLTPLPAGGEPQ